MNAKEYRKLVGVSKAWSSYDRYILDAAKVLLRAGANPNYNKDHYTLLIWVATKASAARCNDNDPVMECLFETMYSILEAAIEGRDYDSIEFDPPNTENFDNT